MAHEERSVTRYVKRNQDGARSHSAIELERYYTQPELWEMERYEGNADQRMRAQGIAEMVDPEVDSVLDVGCGNGFVTRRLKARKLVVGLDPSQEAVCHFTGNRVVGNGTYLPFPDRSFDVVVCVEVLEHLSDDVLARTVRELARVARQHIVIGVPYKQDLREGMTQCCKCRTRYHINLHQRSFSAPEDIGCLVPSFSVEQHVLLGKRLEIRSQFFKTLRYAVSGPFASSPFARCPECGASGIDGNPRRRLRRWLLNRVAWRMPTKVVPAWIILLLTREPDLQTGRQAKQDIQ